MTEDTPVALRLSRVGFDNQEIADLIGLTEADVEHLVSEQRSAELKLPSPYQIHELVRSA